MKKISLFVAMVLAAAGMVYAQSGNQYYVVVNGHEAGPYTVDMMRLLAGNGQVNIRSLVWKEGMSAWAEAGTVPELAAIFTAVPPPMPGAGSGGRRAAPVADDGYQDFTAGQRTGAMFLNLFLGMGSYMMGDIWSGVIITIAEGAGGACLFYLISSGMELNLEDPLSCSAWGTAVGLLAGGVIGGLIMPWDYHKPRPKTAALNDPRNWSIAVAPQGNGAVAMRLAFTAHF